MDTFFLTSTSTKGRNGHLGFAQQNISRAQREPRRTHWKPWDTGCSPSLPLLSSTVLAKPPAAPPSGRPIFLFFLRWFQASTVGPNPWGDVARGNPRSPADIFLQSLSSMFGGTREGHAKASPQGFRQGWESPRHSINLTEPQMRASQHGDFWLVFNGKGNNAPRKWTEFYFQSDPGGSCQLRNPYCRFCEVEACAECVASNPGDEEEGDAWRL